MSAVQNRDVAAVELATWIVSVTGKDAPRVVEEFGAGQFRAGALADALGAVGGGGGKRSCNLRSVAG